MVSWYSCSLVLNSDSVSSIRLPRLPSWESLKAAHREGTHSLFILRSMLCCAPVERARRRLGLSDRHRTHRIRHFSGAVGRTGVGAGRQRDGAREVVVGEVLPQQQCLLVLLPRQTVAVVVYFEGLAPSNRGVIWTMSAWDRERRERAENKRKDECNSCQQRSHTHRM